MPPPKCTGSCYNNSNKGTLFGSQNQMNGQGDQGTLKMNAVHMYCAAAKKILRAARARLQNLGSNLGYPGKSKLHIPSNIQSKHSKVLVPKLHALFCVKALPIPAMPDPDGTEYIKVLYPGNNGVGVDCLCDDVCAPPAPLHA